MNFYFPRHHICFIYASKPSWPCGAWLSLVPAAVVHASSGSPQEQNLSSWSIFSSSLLLSHTQPSSLTIILLWNLVSYMGRQVNTRISFAAFIGGFMIILNICSLVGLRKNHSFLPVPAYLRQKIRLRDAHQYCLILPWVVIYGLLTMIWAMLAVPLLVLICTK